MLVGMPGQSPSNNASSAPNMLAPSAVLSPFAQQNSGLNTSKVQSPMSVSNTVLSPFGQQSTSLNSSNISNAQQSTNNQFITSNGPSNTSTVLPQMTPPHSNNPMQRQMLQNQSQQMNQSNQQGNVNQQPPTPNAQNSQQLTPGSVPHTPNPQTNQMISTSQSQQQQMQPKQSSTQVRKRNLCE